MAAKQSKSGADATEIKEEVVEKTPETALERATRIAEERTKATGVKFDVHKVSRHNQFTQETKVSYFVVSGKARY